VPNSGDAADFLYVPEKLLVNPACCGISWRR